MRRDSWQRRLAFGKFRSRRRKELFRFSWGSPPKSKNAMRPEEGARFRKELKQAFRNHRATPLVVPLAMSIDVRVSGNNPPHIHTIPKNYLDLCQGIVYEDDELVDYLAVRYDPMPSPLPGLRRQMEFGFYPLSALRQDLRLAAEELRRRPWSRHLRRRLPSQFPEIDQEDFLSETPVKAWKDCKRRFPGYRRMLGEEGARAFLDSHQRRAQEYLLRRGALQIHETEAIFATHRNSRARGDDELARLMQSIRESNFQDKKAMARWTQKSGLRMKVLNIPVRSGQGLGFRQDIREQMRRFKGASPLFSDVYSPVALEVLFAPPKASSSIARDLDNVMRKVVPIFHEEFKPPTHYMQKTDLSKLPTDIRRRVEEEQKNFPSGLKHQILNYEVFRVPLDRAAEANGQLSIGICPALGKTDILDRSYRIIEAASDDDGDDY